MLRKRKSRDITLFIIISIFIIVWTCQYVQVNQFYKNNTLLEKEYYLMGENVDFEEDFLSLYQDAKGCTICLNAFEIVSFQEFINNRGIVVDNRQTRIPEKLALIDIELKNESEEKVNFYLPSFDLYGIDSNPQLDSELLPVINHAFRGSWDFTLSAGDICTITLPFMLFKDCYRKSVWNNFEAYPFFLQVTAFPTAKYIQIQDEKINALGFK